jgi:hypothetical protein
MLTGGLLALAGCGGSSHVVTKVVTETRPGAASTPTPTRTSGPSPTAVAAAGAFASNAIAANSVLAASPVGDAVFGPAVIAAIGTMSAAPAPTSTSVGAPTPAAPRTRVVAGHASGEYAVAYTSGTFHDPPQIVLNVSASPAQAGSVDWNVVCFEDSGGIGREEGHSTMSLPTSKTLTLPAPSHSCIGSANVQLSKSGTVSISLTG